MKATHNHSLLASFFFCNIALAADPLILSSDLVYQGAFRVPQGAQDFSYANDGIAYYATNNSLFVKCKGANFNDTSQQKVTEINIPTLVNSSNISSLNTATLKQACADITENHLNPQNITNGMVIGGLMAYNNKLIGSTWAYYDGAGQQTLSHFYHSLNVSQTGTYKGHYALNVSPAFAGYVGGYMTTVPSQWQSLVGGPALTGSCCHAIIGKQSTGPSVWVFDPDLMGVQNPVPATPLVYYNLDHPTLGTWGYPLPANPVYNIMTKITGIVWPTGTRTILLFGSTGLGSQCYGGTTQLGSGSCNDPDYPQDKGVHAYPYAYYVWAYDANDFVSVKNGVKKPWEIVPYSHWQLTLPFDAAKAELNGAAYDPATKRIYVSQYCADNSPVYCLPVIHAFQLTTGTTPTQTLSAPQQLRTLP